MKKLKYTIGVLVFAKWFTIIIGLVIVGFILTTPNFQRAKLKGIYAQIDKDLVQEVAKEKMNVKITKVGEVPELRISEGQFVLETVMTPGFKFVIILMIIIAIGLTVVLLDKMLRIVKDIQAGSSFNHTNTQRLKSIGTLVMVTPVLEWALMNGGRIWIATSYQFENMSLEYENEFGRGFFILGMLIYALGFAFEQGVKMQEENQLTV